MDVNNSADISKKRKLQMDLIIKEGDYKKIEQKKNQIDFEIKGIKKKMDSMKVEIENKEREIKTINANQMTMAEDIKKFKRAINEI